MNIKNIYKSKITTIIVTLFLIADFVLFIFPFFKNEFEVDNMLLIIGAAIGLGLLLSPDTLFQKLKDKI